MSRIVAIGAETRLAGYALAGVELQAVDEPDQVREAWAGLGEDVGLVLLTSDARRVLADPIDGRDLLWAVLPG
jgi:vacuolar-type H+-ATPase subunit F/Vma7